MKIRTAILVLFYVMSSVSVRLEERRWSLGAAEIVTEQGDRRTAIRHGTVCKSTIPDWAGEGVGIVGIVYLAWEVRSVMPGPYRGVMTPPESGTKHRHKATDDR